MLALALAVLSGVLVSLALPVQVLDSLAARAGILLAATLLALCLVWRWRSAKSVLPRSRVSRIGAFLLGWSMAAVGAFSYSQWQLGQALQARFPDRPEAVEIELQARISGLPRAYSDRWSFQLELLEAVDGLPRGSVLQVNWYRAELTEPLRPGDCGRWLLTVRGLRGPVNVAGWEPERLALVQRRSGRASVKARLSECAAHTGLDRWRDELAERIDARLPPSPARASLKALALGDTREFSEADWEGLRATGLTHLMAISGLHIGLLAGFGALLARLLYRRWPGLAERLPRPLAEALLALAFAGVYAGLAGFSLPTRRALAGLAAFLLARLLRRSLGVWSAYGLAVIVVLLLDPLAPLAAGFWLSFGAVAWLLYVFARGSAPRPAWRQLPKAQLLLSLALAPLTAWWFQQGSLVGPLVNLVVVPWVALVAVPLTLLSALLAALAPALADGPLQLAALALQPLWWLVERIGSVDLAVASAAPGLLAVLLASLAVAWLFAPAGVRGRAFAPLLWLPLLWPATPRPAPGHLWVDVLDVGQGQAVLLRTHAHQLLVDAGPAAPMGMDSGEAIVVPSLRQLGVRRLDLLLISHGDNDHAGGAEAVRRALLPSRTLAQLPQMAEDIEPCRRGQRWALDGVEFELLHPPEHFPYLKNESSCVLRIADAFGARLLVPGDIGSLMELRLVREQPAAISADVLIAAHHGSNGSSASAFLEAVGASDVIYSAGWGNRFRMPRMEVLDRVARTGAEQWSTAFSGALHLRSDGTGGYSITALRGAQRRPWRGRDLGSPWQLPSASD
jgi:competence protein ComEC